MPIGLPTRVSFRGCDRLARQRLGYPSMSAVFQPPDGELLRFREPAGSFPEIQAFIEQRREREPGANCPSKQTFYLLDKLHQLDEAMRAKPDRQKWLVEFHPEVSFLKIARQVLPRKKRSAGRKARLERLADYFPDVEEWLSKPLPWTRREVARDDILDAYAGLWTALRVAGLFGAAEVLEDGSRDGPLSMRIMV